MIKMKKEWMNATERVAEALKLRGLFVEVKEDFINFKEGNTKEDVQKIQKLLNHIGIPVFWQDNRFQVLINHVPHSVIKQIMKTPGQSFPIHMEGYHFKWRAFSQRRYGIKVNAMDLDANMAMLVKSLNLSGVTTLAGCNGHRRYAPNVQFSGVYQGAWFKVVQEKFLDGLSLHYNWTVYFGSQSGSCLRAEENGEHWDMEKIYQDTVKMAQALQMHAKEIRELKKITFTRNEKMKEIAHQWVKAGEFKELVSWMKKKTEAVMRATI
jgi:hypothetical protein